MHTRQYFLIALTFVALSLLHVPQARGDQYGLSTYGLGGSAFGAGQTPPPTHYHDPSTAWLAGRATLPILAYVQVVANSGHWERGFAPITGFNRPGIDIGWSFTWTEKNTKLQFDGTTGVTFNFENNVSDYDSGTDFHAEWAMDARSARGL